MKNEQSYIARHILPKYGMKVVILFLLMVVIGAVCSAGTKEGVSIEEAALELSKQIQETYAGPNAGEKPKVAVLEFSDFDGRVNNVGRLLAEELITNLFVSGQFSIVERSLLNKIFEEQQLAREGIVEAEALKSLGRLLGARAIVTGSLIDEGRTLNISARVIATDSGEILAVARTYLLKDRAYLSLADASPSGEEFVQSLEIREDAITNVILLNEDFSGIPQGMLPVGWIAGNDVLVQKSSRVAGNSLAAVRNGNHKLFIPVPDFPEEFRVEYKIWSYSSRQPYRFRIGDLEVVLHPRGSVSSGGAQGKFDAIMTENVEGQIALVAIERKNQVVKVFINGAQVLIRRVPDFRPPQGMTVQWEHHRLSNGRYQSILGLYHVKVNQL